MAPPQLKVVAGARLDFLPSAIAARATAVTSAARSLRNPEISALAGSAHAQNFAAATTAVLGDGTTVPAGTTHVWELPSPGYSIALRGNCSVRVTSMNRAGQTLEDLEMTVLQTRQVPVAATAEYVAITCLGSPPPAPVADGEGAVTFAACSGGTSPAVGWQSGNVFPQVGAASVLARGATLRLRKAYVPVINKQKTTQGMVRISAALADQSGVETWLPSAVSVVMILLDRADATAAEAGDIGIACDGATLATPPVVGSGGLRRALLYDVTARDEKAEADLHRSRKQSRLVVGGCRRASRARRGMGSAIERKCSTRPCAWRASYQRRSGCGSTYAEYRRFVLIDPNDPPRGSMYLYDDIQPATVDGLYKFTVSTDISWDANVESAPIDRYLNIVGPRFSLDPTLVANVYPPRNGQGAYEDALPQAVLSRRTLPWERASGLPQPAVDPVLPPQNGQIPWMALLLFQDGEPYSLLQNQHLVDVVGTAVFGKLGSPANVLCDAVEVDRSLLMDILPTCRNCDSLRMFVKSM